MVGGDRLFNWVYGLKMTQPRYSKLGLEKGVVRLVAYTADWKCYFEREKIELHQALGSNILDIQHVGSTSIPGMTAKPIIDIAIAVNDFEESKTCIPLIECLGYVYRGEFGMPLRHYFVKGDPRLFHIHMCEITSTTWKSLIVFRDYLRRNSDIANDYAALKQQLALKYPQDREAYLEGKAVFIENVLSKCKIELGD